MIFLNSIPKAGTHLVTHLLGINKRDDFNMPVELNPNEQLAELGKSRYKEIIEEARVFHGTGPYNLMGHYHYDERMVEATKDYTRFFIWRDFRDMIISWLHWKPTIWVPNHKGYNDSETLEKEYKPHKDNILWLINYCVPYFKDMMQWAEVPGMVVLKYDDIMLNPRRALIGMSEALDVPIEELVWKSTRRQSATFRRAIPGEWRGYFSQQHVEVYEKVMTI